MLIAGDRILELLVELQEIVRHSQGRFQTVHQVIEYAKHLSEHEVPQVDALGLRIQQLFETVPEEQREFVFKLDPDYGTGGLTEQDLLSVEPGGRFIIPEGYINELNDTRKRGRAKRHPLLHL